MTADDAAFLARFEAATIPNRVMAHLVAAFPADARFEDALARYAGFED